MHRMIAERVRADPQLIDRARAVFERWVSQGVMSPPVVEQWRALFAGSQEELLSQLTKDDERSRTLRSNSPFSVLISPRERWALTRQLQAELA